MLPSAIFALAAVAGPSTGACVSNAPAPGTMHQQPRIDYILDSPELEASVRAVREAGDQILVEPFSFPVGSPLRGPRPERRVAPRFRSFPDAARHRWVPHLHMG